MVKKSNQGKPARRRPRRVVVRPGAAPGTIVVNENAPDAAVRIIAYGPDGLVEHQGLDDELDRLRERWPVIWINVDGVQDTATLRRLQERFALHPLAVEDVANVGQRPKLEPYEEHLFVVLNMPSPESDHPYEQVSLFVGEGLVLTFQERSGDCFDPVRERLRVGKGRIRHRGPDYLAYALIDSIVDIYFPMLDRVGERLEALEEHILASPTRDTPAKLQAIRAELREMRRANHPHRDLVSGLGLPTTAFVTDETRLFLRDCLDHVVRVADLVDAYREESSDLMHLHMAGISNKMNEVMKVLTIMAAIFIPLSFIAGVYGMNFSADSPWNMPELGWRFGYPAVLALMAAVAAGLILFFKTRRWF